MRPKRGKSCRRRHGYLRKPDQRSLRVGHPHGNHYCPDFLSLGLYHFQRLVRPLEVYRSAWRMDERPKVGNYGLSEAKNAFKFLLLQSLLMLCAGLNWSWWDLLSLQFGRFRNFTKKANPQYELYVWQLTAEGEERWMPDQTQLLCSSSPKQGWAWLEIFFSDVSPAE